METTSNFAKNLKISQLIMAGLISEATKESIELTDAEIDESLTSIETIINSDYSLERLNVKQTETLEIKRKILKKIKVFRKDSKKINNIKNYTND